MTNSSVGRSRTVTVVYHFCMKNRLSKILFLDLVPKKVQVVNLKNADLDLIWRIHLECRFYGYMIRFWISPKKTTTTKQNKTKQKQTKKPRKIRLRFRNPDLDFLKKRMHPRWSHRFALVRSELFYAGIHTTVRQNRTKRLSVSSFIPATITIFLGSVCCAEWDKISRRLISKSSHTISNLFVSNQYEFFFH